MEYFSGGRIENVIMVSLRPGDLFLESLQEIVAREEIDAAVVTSGIGSFKRLKFHVISHTGFPPEDRILEIEGPVEVGGIQGLIVKGEPHLHLSVYDCEEGKAYTGHVEPGSEVCYLMELCIQVIGGIDIRRVAGDPASPGVVSLQRA